jgi:hypothetical protein
MFSIYAATVHIGTSVRSLIPQKRQNNNLCRNLSYRLPTRRRRDLRNPFYEEPLYPRYTNLK